MAKKFNIEEMLKIQFIRAGKKGYADNFELEDNCPLIRELSPDEKCIIRINATNRSSYHLTNKRILRLNKTPKKIISYSDLRNVFWMSEDPYERMKLKLICPQRIIFQTDQEIITLDDLGSSYCSILKTFEWYLKSD